MKKQMFSFMAVLALGFAACNNETKTSETTDSTAVNTTTAAGTDGTSISNSGDYAALADEYDRNSEAGKYMDARTGKPIRISVDRTTGQRLNAQTNEPIVRYIYVDNNDWWAYDAAGTRLGRAKFENDHVLYEGDNSSWVEYDVKWKDDKDGSSKMKTDDIKVKTDKDGSTKVKTDDKKVKTDKDGNTKEKNQ